MRSKIVLLGVTVMLLLAGCSTQLVDQTPEAIPSLAIPAVETFERSGPITVSPTRVALGGKIDVKVEGLKPEEMAAKGIALLDPEGKKLQTVVGVGQTQSIAIPAEAQPGSYKIWLADRSFVPNSGMTIVVLDVYDPIPAALRNPDPNKILETYIQAISQKDYALAWQCQVGNVSGASQELWAQTMEQSVQSIKIQRLTQVQSAPKTTDNVFKVQADIEIKLKSGASSDWVSGKNVRFVTFARGEQGWRISRLAATP